MHKSIYYSVIDNKLKNNLDVTCDMLPIGALALVFPHHKAASQAPDCAQRQDFSASSSVQFAVWQAL